MTSSQSARTILHVDLDAFYASVEQRDNPNLKGKPVIVGGPSQRGVVCAASYEARRFGVKSAMPMSQALRACPKAIVVPPRISHYAKVSEVFFAILSRFAPVVEGLSFDEGFLDGSSVCPTPAEGTRLAHAIKDAVLRECELIASVGVAENKFVAKIASDVGKPNGLTVVPKEATTSFIQPMPVRRLWGVGPVTEKSLIGLGLSTIGDVARCDLSLLSLRLGKKRAHELIMLAKGYDDRPVIAERPHKSVGDEDTFPQDIYSRQELLPFLAEQATRAGERLGRSGLLARSVTLKVKFSDFSRVSRQTTLPRPVSKAEEILAAVTPLLEKVPDIETRGVRLTGVSLSSLCGDENQAPQLSLFSALAAVPAIKMAV